MQILEDIFLEDVKLKYSHSEMDGQVMGWLIHNVFYLLLL